MPNEIPESYLPEGVSGSSFDPDVLRAAAEAHSRHPFDHQMEVKSWVILYLLDAWEKIDSLSSGRADPECDCCRAAAAIISGNKSWPK